MEPPKTQNIENNVVTPMQQMSIASATRDKVSLPTVPNIGTVFPPTHLVPSTAELLQNVKAKGQRETGRANGRPKTSADKTFVELFNEAERSGFQADARRCWQKLYEARRLNNPEAYALIAGPAFTAMSRELEGYLDADDPDVPYYLITVNPKDTVRFATLAARVSKCISKKWIRDTGAYYCYCFEQRGTSIDNVYGYHAHIILERPVIENGKRYKYSCFTREVRSTFTAIVGGAKAIDIKPIKPGTEGRVIKYIKGIKKDPSKQPAVEATRLWRRQQGVADFYESTPFEDINDSYGGVGGSEEEEESDVEGSDAGSADPEDDDAQDQESGSESSDDGSVESQN